MTYTGGRGGTALGKIIAKLDHGLEQVGSLGSLSQSPRANQSPTESEEEPGETSRTTNTLQGEPEALLKVLTKAGEGTGAPGAPVVPVPEPES